MNNTYSVIGKSVIKKDARDKVTGKAIYGNDIKLDGMLYARVFRSQVPHAIIKEIDINKAKRLPGVVAVLTYKDIPGENSYGIIIKDEPVLMVDKIRKIGDPIAIIAAETKEIANEAAKLINWDYEELPAVTNVFDAMKDDSPKIHGNTNILARRKLVKGNAEEAFKECAAIVEGSYRTGYQEHAYLEPEVAVAKYDSGILTFWSATQNPHMDKRDVQRVLNLPSTRVRSIQSVTGGGFGGKLDSIVQCHASLLAYHTKRPVKLVYTREESIIASYKRHPSWVTYKTGATKEGKLHAMEVDYVLDTGAYASYGPAVLIRGMVHCTSAYEVPNLTAIGQLVYTNNPTSGAFRGFGEIQAAVAFESQVDMLAEKLGMNQWDFRIKNGYRKGSLTVTNQMLDASVDMEKLFKIVREKSQEVIGIEKDGV